MCLNNSLINPCFITFSCQVAKWELSAGSHRRSHLFRSQITSSEPSAPREGHSVVVCFSLWTQRGVQTVSERGGTVPEGNGEEILNEENPSAEQPQKGKEDPKVTFLAGMCGCHSTSSSLGFLSPLNWGSEAPIPTLKKSRGGTHCSVPALKDAYKGDRSSRCGAVATSRSFHAYNPNSNPMVL